MFSLQMCIDTVKQLKACQLIPQNFHTIYFIGNELPKFSPSKLFSSVRIYILTQDY